MLLDLIIAGDGYHRISQCEPVRPSPRHPTERRIYSAKVSGSATAISESGGRAIARGRMVSRLGTTSRRKANNRFAPVYGISSSFIRTGGLLIKFLNHAALSTWGNGEVRLCCIYFNMKQCITSLWRHLTKAGCNTGRRLQE